MGSERIEKKTAEDAVEFVNSLSEDEQEKFFKQMGARKFIHQEKNGLPCLIYPERKTYIKHSSGIYVKCYTNNDGNVTDVLAPEMLLDIFGVSPTNSQKKYFNAMIEIIIRNGGYVENGTANAYECMEQIYPEASRQAMHMRVYRILKTAETQKRPLWNELFGDALCRVDTTYFLQKCAMKMIELQSEM